MFVFMPLRAHRAALHRFYSAAILICLPLVTPMTAPRAEQIGVTAALRGAVVRTASLQTGTPIGQMSSGQKVFLGDDIKVGAQGRLQVMLLDETVFTLGANSVMRIDEFVYDPGQANTARLTTSIKSGAFRFVSGRVARLNNDAMKVKLPAATIGVRGTSVGGEVEEDGTATVILLGPAPNNTLGLPAGAISVANDFGTIAITRPGFVTQVSAPSEAAPPSPPAQATPEQLERVETSLFEQASGMIAAELGIDAETLNLQQGEDTDGDGRLDSFAGNSELGAALNRATGDGGVTTDNALRASVALTLFGEGVLEMSGDEAAQFFNGVNLGGEIASLLRNGNFNYLGPTQIAELAGLTGTTTFFGSDAVIQDANGNNAGTFSMSHSYDFSNQTVTANLSGNYSLDNGAGTALTGTFTQVNQTIGWNGASGQANFKVQDDYFGNPGLAGQYGTTVAIGDVATNNFANQPSFSTLSNPEALAADQTLNVATFGSLSNVDNNTGANPTASFAQGGVSINLVSDTQGELAKAEGTIFGMEKQ
ncbi:MAG: FecR family protein [Parvibaculales bacterium]